MVPSTSVSVGLLDITNPPSIAGLVRFLGGLSGRLFGDLARYLRVRIVVQPIVSLRYLDALHLRFTTSSQTKRAAPPTEEVICTGYNCS